MKRSSTIVIPGIRRSTSAASLSCVLLICWADIPLTTGRLLRTVFNTAVSTLVASYVSYKTQTIKDVVVIAHQEAVVRIELSDADLQLQNVVVVAQRKLGTETAVLNTVRKSLPVVSGISAQFSICHGSADNTRLCPGRQRKKTSKQ